MPDREKVIKGLEICIANHPCKQCPYQGKCYDSLFVGKDLLIDALSPLKKREEAHEILVETADDMYAMLKEQKKSGCDGCECKGTDDCPLDHASDGNVVCPNGKLSTEGSI